MCNYSGMIIFLKLKVHALKQYFETVSIVVARHDLTLLKLSYDSEMVV